MLIGIRVKTINDESYHFDLEHDTTISVIKSKLQEKTSIPEDRQRLIYKGHVLQNECVIEDYHIEDGHTVHMVARPADFEDLQRRREMATTTASTSSGGNVGSLGSSSLQAMLALSALTGESSMLGGGRNMPTGNPHEVISEGQSLEAVRQGLLTAHTVMSAAGNEEGGDNDRDCTSTREFYLGQWLDVKDTVNQWLEATVMDINYENRKIFVHYNGWPPRWDEWIDFSSERVTLFRTRTVNVTTTQASPMPSNRVVTAPVTGPADVRHLLPELNILVNRMQPLLQEVSLLCSQDRFREQEEKVCDQRCYANIDDSTREEHTSSQGRETGASIARQMPWSDTSIGTRHTPELPRVVYHNDCRADEMREHERLKRSSGLDEKDNGNYFQRPEDETSRDRQHLARQLRELAPLLDRLGRAMTDTAPHLLNLEPSLTTPLRREGSASRSTSDDSNSGESNVSGISTMGDQLNRDTASTVQHMLESMSLGVSPLQRESTTTSQYRPLVTSPALSRSRGAGLLGTGSGNHLDIHIHAIVAPTRSGAPTVLGDSTGVSTNVSDSAQPPITTTLPYPIASSVSERPIIASQYGEQLGGGDDAPIENRSNDSPPMPSLMPEEEEEHQQRRRRSWSRNSSDVHSNISLRDDIEEIYDDNFGEHFRRIRDRESMRDLDGNERVILETGVSRRGFVPAVTESQAMEQSGINQESTIAHRHSDHDVEECNVTGGKGCAPTEPLGYGRVHTIGEDVQHTVDTSVNTVKCYSKQTSPAPIGLSDTTSMSPTSSHHGSKSNRSPEIGDDIDMMSLSNLEKEVALLTEQTQQKQSYIVNDKKENAKVNNDVDVERRRRETSMSFVQRVRRSLSFQQKPDSQRKASSSSAASARSGDNRSTKKSGNLK